MKRLKKLGISLTIAFFAVCCGAVLLFNWQVTGWKALTVPTGSMRPAIPPGSLVLMHSVPTSTLKIGDVITYTNPLRPSTTLTHRIVKSYKLDGKIPAFITKGDANKTADVPVVAGNVKGKAAWHVPYVGAWLSWSKTWLGLAVLVYVPATLLMIEEVMRLNEYWRKSGPYKAALVLAREAKARRNRHLVPASAISLAIVLVSVFAAFPAYALMHSNTVVLANNSVSVASTVTPPPPTCTGNSSTITITGTGTGNNNVNVNNSNNQNASSGNANSNGGTATSGNASNSNCTNITITIH